MSALNAHCAAEPRQRQRPTPRVSRVALLPELAPATEGPTPDPRRADRGELTGVLTGAAARRRPERGSVAAILTVYALNATIMLFMFPVGFALLLYNILGGENLRTTAHVMALTGLGMAIPMIGHAAAHSGLS